MNQTAETTNGLPCVGVADLVDSGSATGDSNGMKKLWRELLVHFL